jgi:hypothetical protein
MQNDPWNRYGNSRWYDYPIQGLSFVAVFIVTYAVAYAIVDAIPYDWGSHDEDGVWSSTRLWSQGTIGFLGALFLCDKIEEAALIMARAEMRRDEA